MPPVDFPPALGTLNVATLPPAAAHAEVPTNSANSGPDLTSGAVPDVPRGTQPLPLAALERLTPQLLEHLKTFVGGDVALLLSSPAIAEGLFAQPPREMVRDFQHAAAAVRHIEARLVQAKKSGVEDVSALEAELQEAIGKMRAEQGRLDADLAVKKKAIRKEIAVIRDFVRQWTVKIEEMNKQYRNRVPHPMSVRELVPLLRQLRRTAEAEEMLTCLINNFGGDASDDAWDDSNFCTMLLNVKLEAGKYQEIEADYAKQLASGVQTPSYAHEAAAKAHLLHADELRVQCGRMRSQALDLQERGDSELAAESAKRAAALGVEAVAHATEALRITKASGERWNALEAKIHHTLGKIARDAGDTAKRAEHEKARDDALGGMRRLGARTLAWLDRDEEAWEAAKKATEKGDWVLLNSPFMRKYMDTHSGQVLLEDRLAPHLLEPMLPQLEWTRPGPA